MYEFSLNTKIYSGKGSIEVLSKLKNRRIMIICDSFISSSGILKDVTDRINGCEVVIFDKVIPNPTVEIISLGVLFLKKEKSDMIIALGGGSSIDAAKAIKEYFIESSSDTSANIEFYAIPTTSGTGSEVTEYSVITNEREDLKYALAKKRLLPDVAILDSDLVKSVPKKITADTGMDVITHAIEAYVSKSSNDFTDALAEKSIALAFENLLKAYEDGSDEKAREKMHTASCLAGIAFNSAGLGLNHGIAHALGGKLHLPHGLINAIILPHVIRFNSDINTSSYLEGGSCIAKKYQNISKILGIGSNNALISVNNLINHISKLLKNLGIPSTLRELNIDLTILDSGIEEILGAIKKDICTLNNPKEVSEKDLLRLIKDIKG